MRANRTSFLIAGVLVVAAVVYLIVSNTGSTASYFMTVEELQVLGDQAAGRRVTVSGAVLGQTIEYDASIPRVTFTVVHVPGDPGVVERAGGLAAVLEAAVHDGSLPRLRVVYDGTRPDLLQDKSQAIMRGQLGDDGRFYADDLLLKCPTRYEQEIPEQVQAGEP